MLTPTQPRLVRVLVIDDEALVCRAVARAFKVADSEEFTFDVTAAHSVAEYQAVVQKEHFDVLVVDLRLDTDEEGVDEILMFHRLHSPETVCIAISAFPGGDKVRSSVHAMQAGAVDVIEKEGGSEYLTAIVQRAVQELNRRHSTTKGLSAEWFESHLPELVREFAGRAVAIVDDRVVDSAPSISELRKKLASLPVSASPYLVLVPQWNEQEC